MNVFIIKVLEGPGRQYFVGEETNTLLVDVREAKRFSEYKDAEAFLKTLMGKELLFNGFFQIEKLFVKP